VDGAGSGGGGGGGGSGRKCGKCEKCGGKGEGDSRISLIKSLKFDILKRLMKWLCSRSCFFKIEEMTFIYYEQWPL